MIKANNKKIKLLLAITVIAALALGVFRAYLLLNFVEPDTGFYIKGTGMGTLFGILFALIIALVLCAGFSVRRIKAPELLDSGSTAVVFSSALCAFLYISVFIYSFYVIATGLGDTAGIEGISFLARLVHAAPGVTGNGLLLCIEALLCLPCAVNHLSICSKEVREKNTANGLLSMAPALFFAVRIIEVFMNTKNQINVSQRSIELVMLCSMMLFFLFEAGFSVNTAEGPYNKTVSKYFAAGLATIALPCIVVLPYLAVSAFWLFEANFIAMDVLECCMVLFAASRLLTLHD